MQVNVWAEDKTALFLIAGIHLTGTRFAHKGANNCFA